MKLRLLLLAAAGVLIGTGAHAQGTTFPWEVTVTSANVATVLPLLSAEAGGTMPTRARLTQAGLSQLQYGAIRNSLIVARLDALTPARLAGLTGTALQVRQSNVRLYNLNKAKLDPVLARLNIVPLVTEDTGISGMKGEDTLRVIRR